MARTAVFSACLGLIFVWNWAQDRGASGEHRADAARWSCSGPLRRSCRPSAGGSAPPESPSPRGRDRARRVAPLVDREDRRPGGQRLPRLLRRARTVRRGRASAHARRRTPRRLPLHGARRAGGCGEATAPRGPRPRRGSGVAGDDPARERRPRARRVRARRGARPRRMAPPRRRGAPLLRSSSGSASSSSRSSSRARAPSRRASSSAGRTGTSTTSPGSH